MIDQEKFTDKVKQLRPILNEIFRDAGDILTHFHKSYTTGGNLQLFPCPPELLTARLGKSLRKYDNVVYELILAIDDCILRLQDKSEQNEVNSNQSIDGMDVDADAQGKTINDNTMVVDDNEFEILDL